jgi:hypothetical protein
LVKSSLGLAHPMSTGRYEALALRGFNRANFNVHSQCFPICYMTVFPIILRPS